jgi:hypothetical protein
MKRELRVDLGELAIALETDSSELHQYLDLETGRIVPVMDELSRELEKIYDEIYDETGNRVVTLEEYLQQWDDPDWQKEMMTIPLHAMWDMCVQRLFPCGCYRRALLS